MYRVYMYALSGPPVTVISKIFRKNKRQKLNSLKPHELAPTNAPFELFTYFLIFLSLNLGKNLIPFYDHQFSDVFGLI